MSKILIYLAYHKNSHQNSKWFTINVTDTYKRWDFLHELNSKEHFQKFMGMLVKPSCKINIWVDYFLWFYMKLELQETSHIPLLNLILRALSKEKGSKSLP